MKHEKLVELTYFRCMLRDTQDSPSYMIVGHTVTEVTNEAGCKTEPETVKHKIQF